jgi:hypothetical protein
MNSPSRSSLSPSEVMQIDQICDAFDRDWHANRQPKIEDFLANIAAELRDDLLRELIATELDLRREGGQDVSRQEYVDRFPGRHEVVLRAFEITPRHSASHGLDSTATHADSSVTGSSERELVCTPETPAQFDRYVVERVLGSGKFGIVYLAHDPRLDRRVAIKVPRPERIGTRDDLQRFVDEAKHAGRPALCLLPIAATWGV